MFYQPVQNERWFSPGVLYSAVNWSKFDEIVTAFEGRIRTWHIDSIDALQTDTGVDSFSIMALACLLTDTLSQYHAEELASSRRTFMNFVQSQFPRLTDRCQFQ